MSAETRITAVNWPRHLEDSGEGGMWVFALAVDVIGNVGGEYRDPMELCHGPIETVNLAGPDVLIGLTKVVPPELDLSYVSLERDIYKPAPRSRDYDNNTWTTWEMAANVDGILAAVLLGSTAGSYTYSDYFTHSHRGDGVYWQCRWEDLTEDGKQLVTMLCKLYDRPVWLATYLDT